MWDHRNKILYIVNKSLYIDERQVVDRAIQTEFILGLNGLENNMANFFSRNVDRILKAPVNMKIQWLASIWSVRDKLREDQNLGELYKDPIIASFLTRDKVKKKRKREEDFAAL